MVRRIPKAVPRSVHPRKVDPMHATLPFIMPKPLADTASPTNIVRESTVRTKGKLS